ncbi:phage tail tube protein [Francisella marina]|uniref:phage tail tube protein n=1 Tax=Francisella marina TaxID=2249302 RepID=UPI0011EE05D9|nr:phage tail tube protein [Francisella marina]QEO58324.1 hypothetical protein F0R75_00505 [Francisella marina]
MASWNNGEIGYIKEIVEGTTPTSPEFKLLEISPGEALFGGESQEAEVGLRGNKRRSSGNIVTGESASGSFTTRLKYGTHNDMIEAALGGYWVKQNRSEITSVSGTSIVVADNSGFAEDDVVACRGSKAVVTDVDVDGVTITVDTVLTNAIVGLDLVKVGVQADASDINTLVDGIDSTILDYTSLGLAIGVHIKLIGFSTGANSNWVRITKIEANKLTLDTLPSGWNSGETGTIQIIWGDYLFDSDVRHTFSLYQKTDTTPTMYEYSTNHIVNTFNMSFNAKDRVDVEITTVGKEMTKPLSSKLAGQTESTLYDSQIFNTSSNVERLVFNGEEKSGTNYISSSTVNINNNVVSKPADGYYYDALVVVGDFEVTGDMTMFLNDPTLIEKARNNEEFNYLRVNQHNDQVLLFNLPAIKLTLGDRGNDESSVTQACTFTSSENKELGYQMSFQSVEAV